LAKRDAYAVSGALLESAQKELLAYQIRKGQTGNINADWIMQNTIGQMIGADSQLSGMAQRRSFQEAASPDLFAAILDRLAEANKLSQAQIDALQKNYDAIQSMKESADKRRGGAPAMQPPTE
jgi:hypothetical protein